MKKEITNMAKTGLEKIADYEEQIIQIRNKQKQERQKLSVEERNARTRRLCSRHGLLEKMMPEIVTIADEQYKAFLENAVTNSYGRDILNKIISQTTATPTPQGAGSAVQSATQPATKLAVTEQGEDTDEGQDGGNVGSATV